MRKVILVLVVLAILLPGILSAQRLDMVELNLNSTNYLIHHYEPTLFVGRIFGNFNQNTIGYAGGLYWKNNCTKFALLGGVRYNTNASDKPTHWHVNSKAIASFPSWKNPIWEVTCINDFGWGVGDNFDRLFNKLEVMYTKMYPNLDAGLRLQSFILDKQRWKPFLGIVGRVKVNKVVSYQIFQSMNLKDEKDWKIQLDVFFKYFS